MVSQIWLKTVLNVEFTNSIISVSYKSNLIPLKSSDYNPLSTEGFCQLLFHFAIKIGNSFKILGHIHYETISDFEMT